MFASLSEIANFTVGIIEAGTFNADDPRVLVCLRSFKQDSLFMHVLPDSSRNEHCWTSNK
jgi:hypothetical protein